MDVLDRVRPHDILQVAIVTASFFYNTALRSERLPAKSLRT
jgi:hypothetical protein